MQAPTPESLTSGGVTGGPGRAILTTRLSLRRRQVRLLVTTKAPFSLGEYLLREPSSGNLSNLKKVRQN